MPKLRSILSLQNYGGTAIEWALYDVWLHYTSQNANSMNVTLSGNYESMLTHICDKLRKEQ